MADGRSGATVVGSEEIRRRLAAMARLVPMVVGNALYAEAQIEMTEAKQRTPVDTGALRASGFVSQPQGLGRDITVALSFGSVAIGYAARVHEDLDAFHTVGQAKFLESTLMESRPHMAQRVARRIRLDELVR